MNIEKFLHIPGRLDDDMRGSQFSNNTCTKDI